MSNFVELGKKIYNLQNPRETRRFAVFVARCYLHKNNLQRLEKFFAQDETLNAVANNYPFVYEQVTRAFFYYKSTFGQRIKLVQQHMNFLLRSMRKDFLIKLYSDERFLLWKMPFDESEIRLVMLINSGQRKEGLMSVVLELADGTPVYQIIFWIALDDLVFKGASGEFAMYIGAMQGPNVSNAVDLIKRLTKKCHAYRTKNLILYAAQAVARALGLTKIFAVTNDGYYANNHIRRDRKLKTSFSDFWQECGGTPTSDNRFYNLPLIERRKTIEEIPSHKRAVYRRRFALLDEIDAAILQALNGVKL